MHVFASHFNDENHYTVLMAIASVTPLLSWLKGAPPGTYPSSHQQKKNWSNLVHAFCKFVQGNMWGVCLLVNCCWLIGIFWTVLIESCCNLFAVRCLLFFAGVVSLFLMFLVVGSASILDTWLTRLCMKPASRTNLTHWSDWLGLNLFQQKEPFVMDPLGAMYQW